MITKNNKKKVFSKKIADKLIAKGFPYTIEKNLKTDKFVVWVFESTPELEVAFGNIVEGDE